MLNLHVIIASTREGRSGGAVGAWFPEGPDDPAVVLLRVDADSAEYWDTPGRVATLISYAKARVTGRRFEGGENERVEME